MEKRILLAFILSFAVFYAFQWILPPPAPPEPPIAQVATQEAAPQQPEVTPTVEPQEQEAEAPPAPTDIRGESAEEVVVDTPYYAATVSNVGGVITSFRLKEYKDQDGVPIELIDRAAAAKTGWPLAFSSGDPEFDKQLAQVNYSMQREPTRVTLEFAGDGIHARKTLDFATDNYVVSVTTTLTKDGERIPYRLVWQGGFGDQSVPDDPAMKNVVYDTGSDFEWLNVTSIEAPIEATTSRVGIEDQYFLVSFLLPLSAPVTIGKADVTLDNGAVVAEPHIAVPNGGAVPVRVYIGPKHTDWLTKADPSLERVLDYGMFEFLARPLLAGLLWINAYVGNFGWAIIILTVIINFVLFPLRVKQQTAMQKMQKIQPQMKTLQDRYKKLKATDPRRAEVQTEMMGLYKEHGVNPMGGCMPLLLQLPVFFAFLAVLGEAIEMRRAPWILWVNDLSQYDPYYIIPILMAATMILQQKMTPTAMDPMQAKMMLFMPVVLSVMFLWVQSGLTLYWLTSNVVGIGQQWFITKYWTPPVEPKRPVKSGKNKSSDTE